MRPFALAAVLIAASLPAMAGDIPRLDIEGWCDHVRSMASGDPNAARHYCIENEQRNYEALKAEWAEATDDQQARAVRRMHFGGIPQGYQGLRSQLHVVVTQDANQERLRHQGDPNRFKFD